MPGAPERGRAALSRMPSVQAILVSSGSIPVRDELVSVKGHKDIAANVQGGEEEGDRKKEPGDMLNGDDQYRARAGGLVTPDREIGA